MKKIILYQTAIALHSRTNKMIKITGIFHCTLVSSKAGYQSLRAIAQGLGIIPTKLTKQFVSKLVLGIMGIFFLSQAVFGQTQFRVYCYDRSGLLSLDNPLDCYSTLPFDEYTITWNNKPPRIQFLDEVNSIDLGWYTFESTELTDYVDSLVTNDLPVVFCIKRNITDRNSSIWYFSSKEVGGYPAELIYNSQTYTPPHDDARVNEAWPDANLCCDYLWVCDYASNQRQESFVQFELPSSIEENIGKEKSRYFKTFPNPFVSSVYLSYNILQEDASKQTTLDVYDIAGNLVRILVNRTDNPGHHQTLWDGKSNKGTPVASGVYLFRLKIGDHSLVTKGYHLK